MSKSGIQPFSAGFSSYPSSFANVCTPSPPPTFSPFSEGISFFEAIPKEPPEVKRAFTNLRKAWLEERAALPAKKKPPTKGEFDRARKVLKKWYGDLVKAKEATPVIKERFKNAMLVKHAPRAPKPSATALTKAEKIIKAIAKESSKRLAAKTVARYALKIVPYLGVALMVKDVVDLARSAPAQRFFRKVTGREGSFSESNSDEAKFHPRIPAGANYHCSVGWY